MLGPALCVAVVLTRDVPKGFETRPEVVAVRARAMYRQTYPVLGRRILAAIQPAPDKPWTYTLLDYDGDVEAEATAQLAGCLARSPGSFHQGIAWLVGEHGVVVDELCLVGAHEIGPVSQRLPRWTDFREAPLARPRESAEPEALAAFQKTKAFERLVLETAFEAKAAALPHSPFDLVLLAAQGQELFVVHHRTGKTDLQRTETLRRAWRDEVVRVCRDRNTFQLMEDDPERLIFFAEQMGRSDFACAGMIGWNPVTKTFEVQAAMEEQLQSQRLVDSLTAKHAEALRAWVAGKQDRALALWTELSSSVLMNDEICRELGQAQTLTGDRPAARQTLESCPKYQGNLGESYFQLGTFLRDEPEGWPALAAFEQALGFDLTDEQREQAREAVAALSKELKL
jgi:hypothetical protein